jgi:hypothetical protein
MRLPVTTSQPTKSPSECEPPTPGEIADVFWVYSHLGDADVKRGSAPSETAWKLLLCARGDRADFYGNLLPQAERAHLESQLPGCYDTAPTIFDRLPRDEFLGVARRLERHWVEQDLVELPPELVTEVRAAIAEWKQQAGVDMPAECLDLLVAELSKLTLNCGLAAQRNPQKLAPYSEPAGWHAVADYIAASDFEPWQ